MPFVGHATILVLALAAGGTAQPSGSDGSAEAVRSPSRARLPLRFVQGATADRTVSAATGGDEPIRLAPPGAGDDRLAGRSASLTTAGAVKTVITSLAVVLGLLFALVWLSRRTNPKAQPTLSGEVVETLGRAPLSGRQEMQLVRIGNKLLLLSVTPTTAETLTEITDPVEIDRLAGICRQNQPDSITASFREILSHHANRT